MQGIRLPQQQAQREDIRKISRYGVNYVCRLSADGSDIGNKLVRGSTDAGARYKTVGPLKVM